MKPGVADALGARPGCPNVKPGFWMRCQSMPRWYSLRSCPRDRRLDQHLALRADQHLVEKLLHPLVLLRGGAHVEDAALAVGDHRDASM
jgi:hypothetical protein